MALEFGGDEAAAAKEPLGTFLFKRPKGGARMAASRDKRVEAEREVKALSEWRHRHIVRFYGAFRDSAHGVAVLVLEAAEGARDAHGNPDGPLVSSLSDADRMGSSAGDFWRYIATRHQLPVWHVKMLTFQVLSAVAYLHRKGVVHRDLKTENLLVLGPVAATKRGPVPTVKVCDFGSARLMPIAQQLGVPLNVAYSPMTVFQVVPGASGQRVEKYQGTLQFVAPEIWRAIHAQAGEISHAKVDECVLRRGPARPPRPLHLPARPCCPRPLTSFPAAPTFRCAASSLATTGLPPTSTRWASRSGSWRRAPTPL
jgi:serine/threonine protein kinase